MKKTCNRCGEKKAVAEFSWRNKAENRKLESCKECYNRHRRSYYSLNKSEEKQRVYKRRDDIGDKIIEYLLSHPCIDCGERDPVVLQFDHVRGTKVSTIAVMLRNCHGWESITKEIAKCDVRCANCHIRKTAKDFKWRKIQKE